MMHPILAASGLVTFLTGLTIYVGPVVLMVALWKRLGVKPSARAIYCSFGWLLIGVLASVLTQLASLWLWSIVLLAVLMLIDLLCLLSVKQLSVKRKLPGRFAINVDGEVELTVINASRLQLFVNIYDGLNLDVGVIVSSVPVNSSDQCFI